MRITALAGLMCILLITLQIELRNYIISLKTILLRVDITGIFKTTCNSRK